MDQYESFIHKSRYARWKPEDKVRESWEDTIHRYLDYMEGHLKDKHEYTMPKTLKKSLYTAIHARQIMPSMRALMTAGEALDRCNVAGYNCSYLVVDNVRAFDEALYILMCGVGVGFSVERKYVSNLPRVPVELHDSDDVILVGDSKAGWARSFKDLLGHLYNGSIPTWDTSKVRPAGARLKTFGGRASGPGPLEDLFRFTIETFQNAKDRNLSDLECHDIMCKIGEIVVVGGVRRSAMISLSNLQSHRLRTAKTGDWWNQAPHRALANNSIAYTSKPDMGTFMEEWNALYSSKSGERGIFNRQASSIQAAKSGRRVDAEFGTNPCSEIILRPNQFCNLSEVVCRADDTLADISEKVRLATVLGTFQSTLTGFKYLRKTWTDNTEEERLLGVSLTGIFDSILVKSTGPDLQSLRDTAIRTNRSLAKQLEIPASTAITCVKPSGTVSQLVNSSSGIHPRYSPYYIRTVRGDNKDPLTQYLISAGVPNEPDVMKRDHTTVFSFPVKGPSKGIFKDDVTAIEHLELWKLFQDNWCEHKPSVTIYVGEDEWMEVGAWVYKNFDEVSGISFLPKEEGNHTYQQAPYQEISKNLYTVLAARMPELVWDDLRFFEQEDNTEASQSFACMAGACEIVDIGVE